MNAARSGLENAYSHFVSLARNSGEPLSPLHIGDTYLPPPVGCRMEDLTLDAYPRLHQYSPIQGQSKLLDAIVQKVEQKEGLAIDSTNVVVTAGATGGLFGLAAAMIEPGDEVIMLAPYWPLFGNSIRHYGGVTKALSVFDCLANPHNIEDIFDAIVTPRTVAVYWNTPHNPTGLVFPSSMLQSLAACARKHNLWIIADEVYEHYTYGGPHTYSRPIAPELTISAYSFSKAFGMAGNRCGYLVGPKEMIQRTLATTRNSFYAVTTAAQMAAIVALDGRGDRWAENTKVAYQATGAEMARILGVAPPQGSTFLFIDVGPSLGNRSLTTFLEACAKRGLLVAPGSSFGPFSNHIRICFTSAPPKIVLRGAEILAEEIERLGSN